MVPSTDVVSRSIDFNVSTILVNIHPQFTLGYNSSTTGDRFFNTYAFICGCQS